MTAGEFSNIEHIDVSAIYSLRSKGCSYEEIKAFRDSGKLVLYKGIYYFSHRKVSQITNVPMYRLTFDLKSGVRTLEQSVEYWQGRDTRIHVADDYYDSIEEAAEAVNVPMSKVYIEAKTGKHKSLEEVIEYLIENRATGVFVGDKFYKSFAVLAKELGVPESTLKSRVKTHGIREAITHFTSDKYKKSEKNTVEPVFGCSSVKAFCRKYGWHPYTSVIQVAVNRGVSGADAVRYLVEEAQREFQCTEEQAFSRAKELLPKSRLIPKFKGRTAVAWMEQLGVSEPTFRARYIKTGSLEETVRYYQIKALSSVASVVSAYEGTDGKPYVFIVCSSCGSILLLSTEHALEFKHGDACLDFRVPDVVQVFPSTLKVSDVIKDSKEQN